MNVIEIAQPGAADVLRLASRPTPQAGAGEALIRVTASGVNRPDVLQRKGLYPPPPGVSDVPGLEVAGVIVSGDTQALVRAGLAVGDRVCALLAGGGYADHAVAPVGQCLPVPNGLSDVEAASLPETLFTVWHNVFDRAALQPGQTLLVHGGSSGIGVAAIQLARARGSRVIVTVGSDAKAQACLALGASHAINYREQTFEAEVLRLTEGRGVDVVLDMVAGPYVAREMSCLAEEGRIAIIAVQGGVRAEFDAAQLLMRRLTLSGSTLRARSLAFKAQLAQTLRQQVWPLLEQGIIKPVIDGVFDAAQAAQAHVRIEAGQHIGKIVLIWPASA